MEFTQSHRPKEAIPESHKCQPGLISICSAYKHTSAIHVSEISSQFFDIANVRRQDYENNIHVLKKNIYYKCSEQPGTTVPAQNKLLCCGIIFTNLRLVLV